jgi:hypothetical protein
MAKQTRTTRERIGEIRNKDVRTCLEISDRSGKRVPDVVTDGGVRLIADYIVELEKEAESGRG